ncbi:DODA-type extradiol aromatic ring-opening family dioxygenase [Leptolyngbya iicbica]|uniref:Dioxygenase n=2 Tax=Cyanophyceae TaxID=3028117 RepID=A0A4Q7EE33_9CYAN|nr:class III extradiol ring-cleavage dioxygenase [Leptolyngbya sp. LK]RZM81721.1 dioxygenase [Leptolyngbya sp. LK]
MTFPTLFISHGAPDLPIREGATQTFLRGLFTEIPVPKAIAIVSAHWLTAQPTISSAAKPATLYDFGGFPPELSQLVYPAPGHPTLADKIANLLTAQGFPVRLNGQRGYDHGVWTPLILADPTGRIPVVQISMQPHETPAHHLRLGKALAPLRDEGVLIVGSGAATHNFGGFSDRYDAPPPDWAVAFDDWLANAIAQNNITQLLNYRQIAPFAARNHPTEEHLLPLFVALGAGGQGRQLHRGFTYGAFSMAAYAFA